MATDQKFNSRYTGEEMENAFSVALAIANHSGIPKGTGKGSVQIISMDTDRLTSDGERIPTSAVVAQAIASARKVSELLTFKGIVQTTDDLPADAKPGFVYIVVQKDNENYVWDGASWTPIGKLIAPIVLGDQYDGVDLTSKFADEISGYTDPGAWIRARILANNFDDIHVNDYIPFTTTNSLNFKARILGIDTYYEYGGVVGHHIDFSCEELWPNLIKINPVNYNNGLIPTENVTSDGTATQYVLTKPMYGVEKVTLSGTDLTGWTYDKDTYTLTFSTAPAAGTMVVTGAGSEYPWLASDAYLYVNSLAGHVANGTGPNPEIKRVDYTNDGIYHYLPDWLKNVIIEKHFLLNKRYSASGVLSDENGWGWTNIGKIWFPTEVEVYGFPVWGSKGGYGLGGSIQYPLFMGNMRRLKKRNGGRYGWWVLSPSANSSRWGYVSGAGGAEYTLTPSGWVAAPVCFRIG